VKTGEQWDTNPRRLNLISRCFQRGLVGHYFSRPLTESEAARFREMIEASGHGGAIFSHNSAVIGAWLCTCSQECEKPLIMFAADSRVNIIAQVAGEKSYLLTGDDEIGIQIQETGAADQARTLQIASIASQVSAHTAAEVAAKVAHATVVRTISNVAGHASDAAPPRVTLNYEKPN
jgi:hypothetical protein